MLKASQKGSETSHRENPMQKSTNIYGVLGNYKNSNAFSYAPKSRIGSAAVSTRSLASRGGSQMQKSRRSIMTFSNAPSDAKQITHSAKNNDAKKYVLNKKERFNENLDAKSCVKSHTPSMTMSVRTLDKLKVNNPIEGSTRGSKMGRSSNSMSQLHY